MDSSMILHQVLPTGGLQKGGLAFRVKPKDNVTEGESFCQETMLPGAVPSFPG
jgi:hypothetical protein